MNIEKYIGIFMEFFSKHKTGDFMIDDKHHYIKPTQKAVEKAEEILRFVLGKNDKTLFQVQSGDEGEIHLKFYYPNLLNKSVEYISFDVCDDDNETVIVLLIQDIEKILHIREYDIEMSVEKIIEDVGSRMKIYDNKNSDGIYNDYVFNFLEKLSEHIKNREGYKIIFMFFESKRIHFHFQDDDNNICELLIEDKKLFYKVKNSSLDIISEDNFVIDNNTFTYLKNNYYWLK